MFVMNAGRRVFLLAAMIAVFFAHPATAEEVIKIQTPDSGSLNVLFNMPDNSVAVAVLFPGGYGDVKIMDEGDGEFSMRGTLNENFLVRARSMFVKNDLATVVVDAPINKSKMNAVYRMSDAHAGDIAAVVDAVQKRTTAPIWLIGTSMGSFSAPKGAIALQNRIKGLVVTSSITRSPKKWKIHKTHPNGIIDMALGDIAVPVLVTSHRDDQCDKTPAADAEKLAAAFTRSSKARVMLFEGGDDPVSDACDAKSQHGYYGIEQQVVDAIAGFIKSN